MKRRIAILFAVALLGVCPAVFYIAQKWHRQTPVQQAGMLGRTELVALARRDPAAALVRLRENMSIDPYAYATCHGAAHEIGHTAFESFGFQGAMHFQDAVCGGRYIHGIIEGKFGELGDNELLAQASNLCGDDGPCLHGVGHGLMIATYGDISKSIGICLNIPSSNRSNCADGVYMHAFDREETGIPKATLSIDEALHACGSAPDAAKESCYFYLPRVAAYGDKDIAAGICRSLPMSGLKNTCIIGYGTMRMKYAERMDDAIANADCDAGLADAFYAGLCKQGVRRYKDFQQGGNAVQ